MPAHQSPQQWVIVNSPADLPRRFPRGAGILVLAHSIPPAARRRLLRNVRRLARKHRIIDEAVPRQAARVHNLRELRTALLKRTGLVLLSPIFPTASHPAWTPVPRMRAAAMARLANRRILALGGMNPRRFAQISALGFAGWAGLREWRTR